tara:strand:+ start:988 stop:1341 length:354 start_codon:yes stop_codon:yes gene_type:complete
LNRLKQITSILSLVALAGSGGDGSPSLIGASPDPVTNRQASTGGNWLNTAEIPTDFIFEIVSRDDIPAVTDRPHVGPGHEWARYLLSDDRGQRQWLLPAHQAMWFAWTTFWQNTGIF